MINEKICTVKKTDSFVKLFCYSDLEIMHTVKIEIDIHKIIFKDPGSRAHFPWGSNQVRDSHYRDKFRASNETFWSRRSRIAITLNRGSLLFPAVVTFIVPALAAIPYPGFTISENLIQLSDNTGEGFSSAYVTTATPWNSTKTSSLITSRV